MKKLSSKDLQQIFFSTPQNIQSNFKDVLEELLPEKYIDGMVVLPDHKEVLPECVLRRAALNFFEPPVSFSLYTGSQKYAGA